MEILEVNLTMKKLTLLFAIAVFAVHTVLAQGTVQFQNNVINSTIYTNTDSAFGKVNASLGIDFGLFWGTTATGVTNLAGIEKIGFGSPGVLAGNAAFTVAGTQYQDTDYFQVVAWDSAFGNNAAGRTAALQNYDYWYTESQILPFALGPVSGPGTMLFGPVSNPALFHSLILGTPEPTTLAIGGLGAAGLLFFRRRNECKS
jgi:hypothetical protein